jgi:hypothetical protein
MGRITTVKTEKSQLNSYWNQFEFQFTTCLWISAAGYVFASLIYDEDWKKEIP